MKHGVYYDHPDQAVFEMTYTVSSGTLNSTIPYHTIQIKAFVGHSLMTLPTDLFFASLST